MSYTVGVGFEDEELVTLRRLSEHNGTSHSETIRMAVAEVEGLRVAARDVLDTWDDNEWAETAGDGELAEAIDRLRKAADAAQENKPDG